MKHEEKIIENKDDIKTEDNSESDVTNLPLPESMPLDKEGNLIDTRIPQDLKPPEKSKLEFLPIFSGVRKFLC